MWIVRLALSRPYTFIVMALAIALVTLVAVPRTPTDIFPEINIPVIALNWSYDGLEAREMERRITSSVERGITVLVNDIDHIESESLSGEARHQDFLSAGRQHRPRAQSSDGDLPDAASAIAAGHHSAAHHPLYSASTVPILQIGLSGHGLPPSSSCLTSGANFIRVQLATVQGASIPFPYGGMPRQICVDINSSALQAKGLSPVDIVNAVNGQNLILPTGTAKLGSLEYQVELNGSPNTVAELNDLPVKTVNGSTIYLRQMAHVRDGFSPQTNMVADPARRAYERLQDRQCFHTLDRRPGEKAEAEGLRADTARRPKRLHIFRSVLFCACGDPGGSAGSIDSGLFDCDHDSCDSLATGKARSSSPPPFHFPFSSVSCV